MTIPSEDDRIDAYLWDAAAPPDDAVRQAEQRLGALRFDPVRTPLLWPAPAPAVVGHRRRWLYGLAAAVVIIAAGWSLAEWRLSWPAGRAWTMAATPASLPERLAVGSTLTLPASESARVNIARIGTMQVQGDARMTLEFTQQGRHRLALERGTVRVRVWAPPGSVVVRTPAGDVIDLGCAFDLTADADRSIVRVRSGWVQLDNPIGESLVPAGAVSEMLTDRAPGVAVFEDASPDFQAAVRALEASANPDVAALVRVILAQARPRDVLTLLLLIDRGAPGRDQFAARAAGLFPPPAGVTANGVLRGDRDGLWRWRDSLPLPPAKSWIRNWRDGLPAWLSGRN